MDTRAERDRGLSMLAVGSAVVVLAVLLFGVTTDSGGPDWISIVTATAGGVWALAGLYLALRNRGSSGRPHATS